MPQATVQLKRPEASKSISTSAAITVAPSTSQASVPVAAEPEQPNNMLAIATAALAFIAFVIQLWIFLT
jgi:hypothetical protein